jgi:3-oxoacyl-[acyl-carrier-protein] synthase II
MRNVVVTGMGLISPLGLTVQESWNNAVAGKSGVGYITKFEKERFVTHIAAEVKGFDAKKVLRSEGSEPMGPLSSIRRRCRTRCVRGFGIDHHS